MVRRGEAEKHGKHIGQRVAVGEGPRLANQKGFDQISWWITHSHLLMQILLGN